MPDATSLSRRGSGPESAASADEEASTLKTGQGAGAGEEAVAAEACVRRWSVGLGPTAGRALAAGVVAAKEMRAREGPETAVAADEKVRIEGVRSLEAIVEV